ncbi:uncharacterized protein LOC128869221 [Anastrepha ludens]|uniref:uncharacterized protein LOC128869221 n=1 Tax=Anastrepha ludens TaxID=28586 RepID=UPI0023AF23CC|nr:uncharacterized protein LOC128869221 [Anastrepha ludens]XP_053967724.1 uncharacterized protein LOC128869221 [Anastrepha ludens]
MKSQEKRQQIFEKNRKMTEGNQSTIEQCLAALTQLVVANHQPISWRSKIEKEIRYLPEFRGEAGTLPSFIEAVNRALADFPSSCDDVYKIIFNLKVQGMAKNILSVSPPSTWDECKQRLKKHYRASRNQMEITSIINNLKVRSIKDLDYRITKILEYISELALFEDDSETVTNIFSGMLVQRTKELVSGPLAFAIMKKLKIQEVREIVVSFVGQDEGNLKSSLLLKHTINNTECHSKYYQNQNYYSDRNSRYENEKPKQLQQNTSKYDRETRHHTNSPQQHSYNTRSYHNNNYNRNRHDVTNSSNEPLRQDSDSTRRQQYRQSEPMEVDVISQTPFETNTTEDIFFIN